MTWPVERTTGPAAQLHHRRLTAPVRRRVWLADVARPALVLGSTQPETDVDGEALAAAGVDLVRRRSGGGAVLLRPGAALWVDVELPAGDALWQADVGRAFHWLGAVWCEALAALGVAASVHTGGLRTNEWSRRVCFAGLGPGEVTVGGRKLVGISQRRTRDGARFQCLVPRRWDPVEVVGFLALDAGGRAAAHEALADVATGLDRSGEDVASAFLAALEGR